MHGMEDSFVREPDWLREPTYEGYPHWEHTTRADDAWNLAEYGESSEGGCYTSDEDE